MRLEIYINDKLIKPFGEDEETTYKLGWSGTLEQLKIRRGEDDKILELVFFKLNSERPDDYPNDFRTFSVGDVVCIEDRAYKCLAEGWQKIDSFNAKVIQTN